MLDLLGMMAQWTRVVLVPEVLPPQTSMPLGTTATLTSIADLLQGWPRAFPAPVAYVFFFWRTAQRHLQFVRERLPPAPALIDSVDLHFVREARSALYFSHNRLADAAARFGEELTTYLAADAVLTTSEEEASHLNFICGRGVAHYVPDCESVGFSGRPWSRRQGLLFLGNFWHAPNVAAVEWIFGQLLPHLSNDLLDTHPVHVVGNALHSRLQFAGASTKRIRLIGQVEDVEPVIDNVLVSLAPIPFGAGTKRKVLQSLARGTPCIASQSGAEGLSLCVDRDYVLATTPEQVAAAVSQLAHDEARWTSLAESGRRAVSRRNSPAAAELALANALGTALAGYTSSAQGVVLRGAEVELTLSLALQRPAAAGLDSLLDLTISRESATGASPLDEIASLRTRSPSMRGAKPLLEDLVRRFEREAHGGAGVVRLSPSASLCLRGLPSFASYLESRFIKCGERDPELYVLASQYQTRLPDATLKALTSALRPIVSPRPTAGKQAPVRPRALVVGVYCADALTLVEDIVDELSRSSEIDVEQRWARLGEGRMSGKVEALTELAYSQQRPKFELVNELFTGVSRSDFDYFLVVDDDIVLPRGFLDAYLSVQSQLDLALAQPARALRSSYDHPIVRQVPDLTARRTLFVEIGPLFSFDRRADWLVPFDLRSPMGWGYGNVWAKTCGELGLRMGIVDCTPVDHSVRRPVTRYRWSDADRGRTALHRANPHLSYQQCFTVTDIAGACSWTARPADGQAMNADVSVVVATRNRSTYLGRCLAALAKQSLRQDRLEVIVIEDGCEADSHAVVDAYRRGQLRITGFATPPIGLSSARNLGILAASAPIVLLLDDDDEPAPDCVEQHLRAHADAHQEGVAVLGLTLLSEDVALSPLMRAAMGSAETLFSYGRLEPGSYYDWQYFWGGRLSFKRDLLVKRGLFDPAMDGLEDVELASRLNKHGLRVLYRPEALQWMTRRLTADDFLARARRQGRAQFRWSTMAVDPAVRSYLSALRDDWVPDAAAQYLDRIRIRLAELDQSFQEDVPRLLDDAETATLLRQLTRLGRAQGFHDECWTANKKTSEPKP